MLLDSNNGASFVPISNSIATQNSLGNIFRRRIKASPTFYEHAPRELPDGWEKSTFRFEGLDIPYHIAHAVKENAAYACVSGLKPNHAVSREMVESCKEMGVSVIWINYPNPGRQTGYMDFYKRLSDFFYTSPDSPFYQNFPSEIPRLVGGHSTGSQNLLNLALSDDTRSKYEGFGIIIAENSFLDNANAAAHDPLYRRIIFTSYALLNYHKLPHETLLGLGYNNYYALKAKTGSEFIPKQHDTSDFNFSVAKFSYKAAFSLYLVAQTVKEKLGTYATKKHPNFSQRLFRNYFMAAHNGLENLIETHDLPSPLRLDTSRLPNEFETPTYGQILETRAPGRELSRRVLRNSSIKPPSTMLIVAGKDDYFSSNLPQERIAHNLGAHFVLADAAHRSFEFDPNARQQALSYIQNEIPAVQKLSDALLDKESEDSGNFWPDYSRINIFKQALSDRFRTVARSMPRLLRRQIFQPEQHTQPEFDHKLP